MGGYIEVTTNGQLREALKNNIPSNAAQVVMAELYTDPREARAHILAVEWRGNVVQDSLFVPFSLSDISVKQAAAVLKELGWSYHGRVRAEQRVVPTAFRRVS